jgi:hypothetical protein
MMLLAQSPRLRTRTLALAAFAAAVYAAALVIVRTAAFDASPDLLGTALAADLVVVVPGVYWWLLVRRGAASWRSLLAVVALSVLGARLVLPVEHRSFVGLVRYATAPLELALMGYGVWRARRALRAARAAGHSDDAAASDVAELLEQGFVAALGDRAAARVAAAEAATLYFALLAPARRPPSSQATMVFSHQPALSGSALWGFALVIVVESIVMHLWLARSHPVAAWVLVALGVYSILWLVGHARAMALRPIALAGDVLVLRAGLRLDARLALSELASAEHTSWRTAPAPAPGYLDAARPGTPNVVVTLRRPTLVTGVLGLRRTVTRIGLSLDEPARFVAVVHEAILRDAGPMPGDSRPS